MVESLGNVGEFLELRRDEVDGLWSADPLPFIMSEQALLLGHPLHPTPKSRGEMNPRERRAFSPETQAEFRLRWIAAAPHMVRHASATGTPAPVLAEQLARHGSPDNRAAVDAVRDLWPDRRLDLLAVLPTSVNTTTNATRAAFEAIDADPEMREHVYRRGIRQCIDVTYALTQRQTIWEYAPRSRAAEDFDAFVRFVTGRDATVGAESDARAETATIEKSQTIV